MNAQSESLDWLVRDNHNFIHGPYSHEKILQMLKKGQLRTKTEIAKANSYWFSIDEKAEVLRFFPELGDGKVKREITLTKPFEQGSNHEENSLEQTQFTPSPFQNQNKLESEGQSEWLSHDFAEEYGDSLTLEGAPAPEPLSPIAALEKGLGAPLRAGTESIKKMHATSFPAANGTSDSISMVGSFFQQKKALGLAVLAAILAIAAVGVFLRQRQGIFSDNRAAPAPTIKINYGNASYAQVLRKAFILYDLETARAVEADIEHIPAQNYLASIAKAMIKRNFLLDLDGALASLAVAGNAASDAKSHAEVDNLVAIYSIDKDASSAISHAQAALDGNPSDDTYRYNLALANFRLGQLAAADQILQQIGDQNSDESLLSDVYSLRAWIADLQRNNSAAEELYHRALDRDPKNDKARLLYALHKLQMSPGNIHDAEPEFRRYIDDMPDLEISRVENFRKMTSSQIYDYAREQIREFNSPSGSGKVIHPSATIMAVDAILSAIQNKLDEADKIIESAWSISPGDADVFKARAYLRWREAKYDEVADLLKEFAKDQHGGPAIEMLLGMSYARMNQDQIALKYFQAFVQAAPDRSEAWSLLAEVEARLKQSEEAKLNFQKAISKNPLDLRALQGLNTLGDERPLSGASFAKILPF